MRIEAQPENFISLLKIEDFDLLITIAVGSRHILHEEISNVYKKNREVYYQFFKESPYANDHRLSSLSVENYKAIQQFIGIYLYEKSLGSNEITKKFIRKGFRFIYQYINHQFKVDFYKLRDEYIDYVKRNAFEKNVHLGLIFGIALYLCKDIKKPIIFDTFDVKLIQEAIQQVFVPIKIVPEIFPEVKEYLDTYKEIGILKKDFSLPLKDFVVAFNRIHGEVEKNQDHFLKGMNKVGLILQYCQINPLDIQNITTIDHQTLKELTALALSSIEMFGLSEEVESLLGTYLLIYALAQDYHLTKYNLMVTAEEETYLELKNMKKQYGQKLKKLELEEQEKRKQMEKLQNVNQELHEKVRKLEKELFQKEKLIEKQQKELEEKKAAYEWLQNQWKERKEERQEKSLEEIVEFLQGKKCVVVGGLKNWQDQLKQWLPEIRFIQPEELNIDFSFLQNVDLVMFNEAVNNHAMYQKIKKVLENSHIPICYSGSSTNVYVTLGKMYNSFSHQDD